MIPWYFLCKILTKLNLFYSGVAMVNGGKFEDVQILGKKGLQALHAKFVSKTDIGYHGVRSDFSQGGINRFR